MSVDVERFLSNPSHFVAHRSNMTEETVEKLLFAQCNSVLYHLRASFCPCFELMCLAEFCIISAELAKNLAAEILFFSADF